RVLLLGAAGGRRKERPKLAHDHDKWESVLHGDQPPFERWPRPYSSGAATSMAAARLTAVSVRTAPCAFAPGGRPSRAKANRRPPAGEPATGSGSGRAQSGVGPSTKRSSGAPAGASASTRTRRGFSGSRRTDSTRNAPLPPSATRFGTR